MSPSPHARSAEDVTRFEDLSYEDFRRLALDQSLSGHEKVGFPLSYREGKEQAILDDLTAKVPALKSREKLIVDVGPGCSPLALAIIELSRRAGHRLVLIDSPEMLAQLPEEAFVRKVAGRFPEDDPLADLSGRVNGLLVYSVLHYVFVEGNAWGFVDRALELLAPGGTLLLGDVPNVSKRRRFFASEAGISYHRAYTGTNTRPDLGDGGVGHGRIDDAVVLGLIARARAAGFDAYVVPQPAELPMANRREDIVVTRP
jgi:hypothetical protein